MRDGKGESGRRKDLLLGVRDGPRRGSGMRTLSGRKKKAGGKGRPGEGAELLSAERSEKTGGGSRGAEGSKGGGTSRGEEKRNELTGEDKQEKRPGSHSTNLLKNFGKRTGKKSSRHSISEQSENVLQIRQSS